MKHALALAILLVACKDETKAQNDKVKIDTAKLSAKRLAFEAYPQWAAGHPEKECPDRIADLLAFVDAKHEKDPWGASFTLMCGKDLPKGARGVAISSPGPDGKSGTADDITSWE